MLLLAGREHLVFYGRLKGMKGELATWAHVCPYACHLNIASTVLPHAVCACNCFQPCHLPSVAPS
jgi:hypothetical protein